MHTAASKGYFMHLARSLVVSVLTLTPIACETPPPASLHANPSGPLRLKSKGASEQIDVTAKDAKLLPYTSPIQVSFRSLDESVAEVSDTGLVTAVSSGNTRISASAGALATEVEVQVRILGSVEIASDVPRSLSLRRGGDYRAQTTVKDDRGQVMDPAPPVSFSVSNYCIDVDPDGTFRPVSVGKCELIATAGSQSARLLVEVGY
ncbi:MAG: Ig-like domain-containing protein [Myxococcota bacterium]